MPATPDDTTLDLIMDGDWAGADQALHDGHPDTFKGVVMAAVLRAVKAGIGTSPTSETIGTGTKNFTLAEARGWVNGTPVFIMEDGAPSTNFMVGKLTADESGGAIVVNVTEIGGSGTFTAWTILALFATTTVATPPLAVADGGTGATTETGARSVFEVVRVFSILSIESTPPGTPGTGDQHLVGDAPTGDFATHENEIATYNGATWDFETPNEGDQAYDFQSGVQDQYVYVDSSLSQGGLWVDSKWKSLTDKGRYKYVFQNSTLTVPVDELSFTIHHCDPTGGSITLTLTNFIVGGLGSIVVFHNDHPTNTVTLNVEDSGTIDDAASLVLNEGDTVVLFAIGNKTWVSTSSP